MFSMKKILSANELIPFFAGLLLIVFSPYFSFATHERAGEITYRCPDPVNAPLTYEFSITTYTKMSGASLGADRCFLEINFGDDTVHYLVCRSNFEPGDPIQDYGGSDCNGVQQCGTHHMGQWTTGCSLPLQTIDVKKNVYTTTHTYIGNSPSSGYIISVTDANRNHNIVNIPLNSTPFSIQDTLVINFFLGGCNNSVTLQNCPIDKACAGKLFVHNPGAVDIDGDSVSYVLGECFEGLNMPIGGYTIPAGVSVDPLTGDFIWNVPPALTANARPCDEYNFAMDIVEWRRYGSSYIKIGTVRRDMQITVCDCRNEPPVISNVNDTCIEANTALTVTVTATDGDGGIQYFTATGGPFTTTPSATFTSDAPIANPPSTGIFSWAPTCNQVRQQPYLVTFKAVDDGAPDNPPMPLSDYESMFITVIAPAPKNLTAVPICTSMKLEWDAALCNPAGNSLQGYRIYRKIACDTNTPGYCETGMPSSWGYSLIASVAYNITDYTDDNGGSGLVHGFIYSYRVVAHYFDGAQSYVSNPVCNKLVRDVPIITNVDVKTTDLNGSIEVKWLKPIADSVLGFDTLNNPGPYTFDLYRASGYANPTPPVIATFTSTYFATLNTTSYIDTPLPTSSTPFTYRVDFRHGASTAPCPAQKASSVFLSCIPNDNQIQITWNEQVPWTNNQYDVYRYNSVTPSWDSISTTTSQTFTDTGLVNGANYCYKVKSIGAYPDATLPAPLINWSQELCCSPVDLTPPCAVALAVDSSCDLSQNILTWNNPNNSCSDDAIYYILYFMPVEDGDFSVLDTIYTINAPIFLDDSLLSIAGCYAVTSVDSFGNESAFSNLVCVDNCPYYELPNVFTPNGDGSNDFFTPLLPYKYVKDIDIKIYNRWGNEMFRTTDPEIMWDGTSAQTKMLCSDGVYYYVCIVNDIRLKGIIPRVLKGNVHLLSK